MIPNVIVPVLNRYDLLQRLLDSIDFPVRDLLVIDNGGDVDALRFPDYVLNSHILSMPSNLGVPASWNLGMKLFPHDPMWIFASNDAWFPAGSLQRLQNARRDEITLSGVFPHWQVFAVGDGAHRRLGFFDEGFYPAYFEDNDMERRAEHHGVTIRKSDMIVGHDNSSTINSDAALAARNTSTFVVNRGYYFDKVERGDFGEGRWSMDTRRLNSWD